MPTRPVFSCRCFAKGPRLVKRGPIFALTTRGLGRLFVCWWRRWWGGRACAVDGRYNVFTSRGDAVHNRVANNTAQDNNSSGQNHPVNGHSARFVVLEFFEEVKQFHNLSLSWVAQCSHRKVCGLMQPLFCICSPLVWIYSLSDMAGFGANRGIFEAVKKILTKLNKILILNIFIFQKCGFWHVQRRIWSKIWSSLRVLLAKSA
jgi:hypothetical protein